MTGSSIYCGTLRVQTNAHVKPRGKRKQLLPHEKQFRDVHGVVWVGDDIEVMQRKSHTIGMICRILKINNRDAIRIIEIKDKKFISKSFVQ